VVDVTLELDLTYSEHPIRVLDQKDRITRKRTLKDRIRRTEGHLCSC
jgi:hypothetical protein